MDAQDSRLTEGAAALACRVRRTSVADGEGVTMTSGSLTPNKRCRLSPVSNGELLS